MALLQLVSVALLSFALHGTLGAIPLRPELPKTYTFTVSDSNYMDGYVQTYLIMKVYCCRRTACNYRHSSSTLEDLLKVCILRHLNWMTPHAFHDLQYVLIIASNNCNGIIAVIFYS